MKTRKMMAACMRATGKGPPHHRGRRRDNRRKFNHPVRFSPPPDAESVLVASSDRTAADSLLGGGFARRRLDRRGDRVVDPGEPDEFERTARLLGNVVPILAVARRQHD